MTVIGRVGHEILKLTNPAERRQKIVELATKVDWTRDTEHGRQFWSGTILTGEGGLLTSKAPVMEAVIKVKKTLGLDLNDREKAHLDRQVAEVVS